MEGNSTATERYLIFLEDEYQMLSLGSVIDDALFDFRESLEVVYDESRVETFYVSISSASFASLCLVLLFLAIFRIIGESDSALAAQDKLARQQAHEMRNLYAPAIHFMDAFVESTDPNDYYSMKGDMRTALHLLKEVELQHQSRLDMYKILRGRYSGRTETFDVLQFLQNRVKAEDAVARATRGGETSVTFTVGLGLEFGKAEEIQVQTDLYCLNHIVSNLLSNARKHCYVGKVVVEFKGADDQGRLLFSVLDEGVGIPNEIRSKLFATEVVTGDLRGTGLGLPSTALFAKAAGGYVRLVDTRLQDESGKGGFTEFEFAVAGRIIQMSNVFDLESPDTDPLCPDTEAKEEDDATTADGDIPDNVTVVIIDDSAINRTCILRSLRRVVNIAGADGWTFRQCETIEQAQPVLEPLADIVHTIVTIDENCDSKGGKLTGTNLVSWLVGLQFQGLIVSASGDAHMGQEHLHLGAHIAWGKPIASVDKILEQLRAHFNHRPRRGGTSIGGAASIGSSAAVPRASTKKH